MNTHPLVSFMRSLYSLHSFILLLLVTILLGIFILIVHRMIPPFVYIVYDTFASDYYLLEDNRLTKTVDAGTNRPGFDRYDQYYEQCVSETINPRTCNHFKPNKPARFFLYSKGKTTEITLEEAQSYRVTPNEQASSGTFRFDKTNCSRWRSPCDLTMGSLFPIPIQIPIYGSIVLPQDAKINHEGDRPEQQENVGILPGSEPDWFDPQPQTIFWIE